MQKVLSMEHVLDSRPRLLDPLVPFCCPFILPAAGKTCVFSCCLTARFIIFFAETLAPQSEERREVFWAWRRFPGASWKVQNGSGGL